MKIFTGFLTKLPLFMVSIMQKGELKYHTFYLFLGPPCLPPWSSSQYVYVSQMVNLARVQKKVRIPEVCAD